jgi:hypothetical protein
MKKQTKIILGVGGLAILGYILLKGGKKKANASGGGTPSQTAGARCPSGQVTCPNNKDLCYDPNVNYVVDPCRNILSTSSQDSNQESNQAVEDYCQEQLRIALMSTRFSTQAIKNAFIKNFLKNCRQNNKLTKYRVTLPNGYAVGSWLDRIIFELNKNMPSRKIAGYVYAVGVNDGVGMGGVRRFQYINVLYGTPIDGSSEYSLRGYQIPLNYLEVVG